MYCIVHMYGRAKHLRSCIGVVDQLRHIRNSECAAVKYEKLSMYKYSVCIVHMYVRIRSLVTQ